MAKFFKTFCKTLVALYCIAFIVWMAEATLYDGRYDYQFAMVYVPVFEEPEPEYEDIPEEEYIPEPEPEPEPEMITIERLVALYSATNLQRVGHIVPGEVVLLDTRDENWVKIDTQYGEMWANTHFEIPYWEIDEFLSPFADRVTVHFENLATGFNYALNGGRRFFGASATKVNFGLYIYHKAAIGETDLNSVHTYTAGDFWEGSGFIRHRYNYGAQFTQRELLHLMLAPSDNIATRILRRVHGLDGFRAYIEEIGGNPDFVQNLTYSYLSANEAGIILREIYNFITTVEGYGQEFKDNLTQNRYPFIVSDTYTIASKSGWAGNFGAAFHDMAVVFAPSPYTLAVLSSQSGTQADFRMYRDISLFFEAFNDTWFRPGVLIHW